MSLPPAEPTTAESVQQWVEEHAASSDRFAHIAAQYEPHRNEHRCYDVYPFSNGPLLGTLAAAAKPRRLLEIGCGLGYSGLWLAFGASAQSQLQTIEINQEHAGIARENFASAGFNHRIEILRGSCGDVLPKLTGSYDLIYFDTDPAESLTALDHAERLLRPGGLLISANLFLGQYAPDIPGLEKTAEYRVRILDSTRWLTAYLPDGTAISVRE